MIKLMGKDDGIGGSGKDNPDITIDMLSDSNIQDNTDNRTQAEKDAAAEADRVIALDNESKEKAKGLGGAGFNATGDLLDDKGTVIKTKAELESAGGGDLKAKAKELGGVDFNATGDLVDATGKVLKTKAEVEAASIKTVEIFEDEATGNITDKDGKVLIKKEDVKRDKEGNVLVPDELINPKEKGEFMEELQKFVGIRINDEAGKPVVYDDSEEGISNYVKDAVEVGVQEGALKLFGQLPDVRDYYLHRANGGKPEDFFKEATDWTKVTFDKTWTPEVKMDWIIRDLTAKGVDVEDAKEMAKAAKDKNTLDERAEKAITSFKEADKVRSKKLQEEYNARALDEQTKATKYWDGIKAVVTKGELEGMVIPEKDRASFFDYISKPVDKEGNTQEMLDNRAEAPERNLQLSFLRYKKYNLKDIVQREVATSKAKSIREKIAGERTNATNVRVVVKKAAPAGTVPTLDEILGTQQ